MNDYTSEVMTIESGSHVVRNFNAIFPAHNAASNFRAVVLTKSKGRRPYLTYYFLGYASRLNSGVRFLKKQILTFPCKNRRIIFWGEHNPPEGNFPYRNSLPHYIQRMASVLIKQSISCRIIVMRPKVTKWKKRY